ncbi:glycosyltransferase 87 family protein [Corynebacterium freiburgense]|uniref:glycosyltransferase 87 family protein n=1 Tax=Corynebacterium freiburgense TaxID=556548 RepID=UPI000A01D23E|nr:glycosyltransferase 87 family protein [Corynebacterium freiburgense]WJZ03175.1 Polyprenol-phosphate-mannose-dependent alpha-(1-2)-phosphatidylinositol mannoside mannosyltransferase [Corynebacterium freiburgense]
MGLPLRSTHFSWIALIAMACAVSVNPSGWRYQVDVDVYRQGALALLTQPGELYTQVFHTEHASLPFTYPPFGAIVLIPLGMVPQRIAEVSLTVVSIGCLFWSLRVVLSHIEATHLTVPLTTIALLCEPATSTLSFGQINIALMAFVLSDALATNKHLPRGALTGIAAAIKLTPAVFFLYFLLRKDYRSLGWTLGSFTLATGFAAVIRWDDTFQYFHTTLWQTERIGDFGNATNISVMAALTRTEYTSAWPWIIVIIGALACWAAYISRFDAASLLSIAVFGLCASPISWSHHWVWLIPATILCFWSTSMFWKAWAIWAITAMTIGQVHKWLPFGQWSLWENILAIHYIPLGLAFVIGTIVQEKNSPPKAGNFVIFNH